MRYIRQLPTFTYFTETNVTCVGHISSGLVNAASVTMQMYFWCTEVWHISSSRAAHTFCLSNILTSLNRWWEEHSLTIGSKYMLNYTKIWGKWTSHEFFIRLYVSSTWLLRGKFQFHFPEIFHDGLISIPKPGAFWTSKVNVCGTP